MTKWIKVLTAWLHTLDRYGDFFFKVTTTFMNNCSILQHTTLCLGDNNFVQWYTIQIPTAKNQEEIRGKELRPV